MPVWGLMPVLKKLQSSRKHDLAISKFEGEKKDIHKL